MSSAPPSVDPLVVLLPGDDSRVLGTSARTRNQRVITRTGATLATADGLDAEPDAPAVLVPPRTLVDVSLFPLPHLDTPTWLVARDGARVLVGTGRSLRPYADEPPRDSALPEHAAPAAAILDASTAEARCRSGWTLLRRTEKPTDGWVARHLNRRVSRPISFVLLSLRLKAGHASFLTLLIGLASAGLLLQPGYWPLVGGGVLFKLASIADGIDGEMARSTLTESEWGALLDTLVDNVTYVTCFTGEMVGWIREGAGLHALYWILALVAGLVFSLVRGGRFVARYAPNASFVFIDRSVRRAARDTGIRPLRAAAAMFTLLRRDAFATVFLFVTLSGQRALIPFLVAGGILVANLTMSWYRVELENAAIAEGA